MKSQFTTDEKRKWLLKKHIKDHAFEYILDIVITVVCAFLLLKLSRAEDILLGVFLSLAWALGRVVRQIHYYKKSMLITM